MATIKVVAFDKTGTLTAGKPIVTHVEPIGLVTADELLIEAAPVEARSEHPLAASIVNEAKRRGLSLQTATDFLATPGQGVEVSGGHNYGGYHYSLAVINQSTNPNGIPVLD